MKRVADRKRLRREYMQRKGCGLIRLSLASVMLARIIHERHVSSQVELQTVGVLRQT